MLPSVFESLRDLTQRGGKFGTSARSAPPVGQGESVPRTACGVLSLCQGNQFTTAWIHFIPFAGCSPGKRWGVDATSCDRIDLEVINSGNKSRFGMSEPLERAAVSNPLQRVPLFAYSLVSSSWENGRCEVSEPA